MFRQNKKFKIFLYHKVTSISALKSETKSESR